MKKSYKRTILAIGVLFLFLGASATLCVSAKGPWSDNFDSYINGQLLDGTGDDGGWIGWANNPAAYGTVTNANFRSSPHSVDIKITSDLVHLYGETSGEWIFTAWQYIPVGQSGGTYGGTYFIMNDVYTTGGSDTHWAVQIQFDNINNVVESEFDTGNPTLPLIYGQWVEIRVEIDFITDWFKFYYNDQLLIQKAWTAGVNNLDDGTLCLAALDLFADSSTTVYYDDLSFLPVGDELSCGAGGPYFGEVDEEIQFTGSAFGGTAPYTYAWDFGDGNTGTGETPTHAYTEAGVFNVTLTVTDSLAATASAETTATITAPQPVIEIGEITGGLFKVKAIIKNTGDAAATDVAWSVKLAGGIILLGKETTGTIPTIAAGGEETVSSTFILGFGKTTITVTADTATKDAAATVLLFFIKI
ncbi:MAG: PKD domain-containing protein [Thermoplasmata archaeon]|nr:PKD domain-containing protein [Thermoplasmata archaeon]MBE3140525.1 PKD domain-containing protein [Thermoplasmata archaeon]